MDAAASAKILTSALLTRQPGGSKQQSKGPALGLASLCLSVLRDSGKLFHVPMLSLPPLQNGINNPFSP